MSDGERGHLLSDTIKFPQRRVTRAMVEEYLARSALAEQVTLPIETWRAMLEELLATWDEIAMVKGGR